MISEVLTNIDKGIELLNDLKARIQKDETVRVKTTSNKVYGYNYTHDVLKSSKADIERTCKMARNILKECYGENYKNKNYRTEIINIVVRSGGK